MHPVHRERIGRTRPTPIGPPARSCVGALIFEAVRRLDIRRDRGVLTGVRLGVRLGLALGLGLVSAAAAQETPVSPALEAARDPLGERASEISRVPSAIAQFTTGITDREPNDQISFIENDVRTVFFFSDLRNLTGEVVTHRWSYEGRVIASVPFEVRGPRWRVWSSKEMKPEWTGDWTVEILKTDGEVVAAETFSYTEASN